MSSNTTINKKAVLVVYVGAVEAQLTHTVKTINKALLDAPTVGLPSTAGYIREFLLPSAPDTVMWIRRGSPFVKRERVLAFYHSAIPDKLKGTLVTGPRKPLL